MNGSKTTRFETVLGFVLRLGSITSTVCLAVGLAPLVAGRAVGLSTLIMNVGLIVLMATPVARVVTSVVQYATEGDWTFVVLTLIVLLVLMGSLYVALTG